jgi:exosome complex component RRP41
VALADAGIPMKDLVSACAVGKYEGRLIVDLGDYEDKKGESDMPVAYMPKFEQVTLLQMEGILSREETEECVTMAIDGCRKVYEIQKEALKKKYAAVREEAAKGATEAPEPEPEPEPKREEAPAEEAEKTATEEEPQEENER